MYSGEALELLPEVSEHDSDQPGVGHGRRLGACFIRASIAVLIGVVVLIAGVSLHRANWISPAAKGGDGVVSLQSAGSQPVGDWSPSAMGLGAASAQDCVGPSCVESNIFTEPTPVTFEPTTAPTLAPTFEPTTVPTLVPTLAPTFAPSTVPPLVATAPAYSPQYPSMEQILATNQGETLTTMTTITTMTTETQTTTRKGSFLVLGDWGFDPTVHGTFQDNECQRMIATQMLGTMQALGDVKFIINVGDSFYPHGVTSKDDPQWETKWRSIYDKELRSVPWYSVYGNHDYQGDPCACAETPAECGQTNWNIKDLDHFYMPGTNWFKEHPELDLEVVALDLNFYMWGWNTNAPPDVEPEDCKYTTCEKKCKANLRYRASEALDLFYERYEKSKAKNLLVFSHYPTDYLWNESDFLATLSDPSRHHIEYFAGHRHSVDQQSTWQTKPNNNWLVGGGGGWGCEGGWYMYPPRNGFVVGEIQADGTITTYPILANATICCPEVTEPKWPPKFKY